MCLPINRDESYQGSAINGSPAPGGALGRSINERAARTSAKQTNSEERSEEDKRNYNPIAARTLK
jgi:hypothetical protein